MATLLVPDLAHLPDYAAALQRGWSADSTRNTGAEQLARIAEDAAAFIAGLCNPEGGASTLRDGTVAPMLPGTTRWIWDEGFCGSINLRHRHGTADLPPHVSGHIGYSVVPWRQREGHATRALAATLPLAAARGLPHVILTCDTDNPGSRKVIERNGGVLVAEADDPATGTRKLVFRLGLHAATR